MKRLYSRRMVIICILIFIITLLTSPYGYGENRILPLARMAEVEELLFGEVQEDLSYRERIDKMEETLYGTQKEETLLNRAEDIIDYVLHEKDEISLDFKLNVLEWMAFEKINQGPIIDRVDRLEKHFFGESKEEFPVYKVEELIDFELNLIEKILPADTLVRIEIAEDLSSREANKGEKIKFMVSEDVFVDDHIAIPKGTTGHVSLENVISAGWLGRDADFEFEFDDIKAIDDTAVSIKFDDEAEEENRSRELAVGAGFLGSVILGPVGFAAGIFVQGSEKEIPAGTEIFIQTEADTEVVVPDTNLFMDL